MLVGVYNVFIWGQYEIVKRKVVNLEADINYDKELLYNMDGGEPVFLINPEYRTTLFFMDDFRRHNPAGMYEEWFKNLHHVHKINIVSPIYGLQSAPFEFRNRKWNYIEDMRSILQIYDAYAAMLPKDHKIVTVSQSSGSIANMIIAAKGKKRPSSLIFLSPLNNGGKSEKTESKTQALINNVSRLKEIILFSKASPAENRESVWDIVNKEKSINMSKNNYTISENNSKFKVAMEEAAKWMEESLMPSIKHERITVIWGENDVLFESSDYKEFANIIKKHGNLVKTVPLKKSGGMVLFDNEEERVKKEILNILTQK